MLLAAGTNKDAAANDDVTPMYFAAQNGHAEVLQMLLAAGANKYAANFAGKGETLPEHFGCT
jgi:ankyrin repeat protein